MKKRNPLFVAGFPFLCFTFGYIPLMILDASDAEDSLSDVQAMMVFAFAVLFLLGSAYTIFWLVSTARVLRRETSMRIPNSILIAIPIASYWWMWRYSQAAENFVKEKQQAALIFVLLAALGSIGMGIIQDTYNKLAEEKPADQLPPEAPTPPAAAMQ